MVLDCPTLGPLYTAGKILLEHELILAFRIHVYDAAVAFLVRPQATHVMRVPFGSKTAFKFPEAMCMGVLHRSRPRKDFPGYQL